jgi:hypothetical protein
MSFLYICRLLFIWQLYHFKKGKKAIEELISFPEIKKVCRDGECLSIIAAFHKSFIALLASGLKDIRH